MSKTVAKKTTQSGAAKKAKTEVATPAVAPTPAPVVAPVVAPVATPAPAKTAETQEQEGGKRKRFFKCVYEGKVHGRYSGDKPKQAANKAFTNIIRTLPEGGVGKKVRFQMKECTRGSNQKTSTYEGERVKLDTPLKIEIKKNTDKPKVIEYKFTNRINKVKEQTQTGGDKKKVAKKTGAKTTKATTKTVKASKPAKASGAKKEQKGGEKKVQKATKSAKSASKATTEVKATEAVKAN